ncbi:MAG: hypothetical protein WBV79_03745 [Rhodomicrobium sp.]
MTLKTSVLSVCAVALLAGPALAQMSPPPPAPPPMQYERAPVYDPGQLPAFNGRVQQFTLTPRGDIDGFILTDGTEVKTPPHLSTQVAVTLRNGDAVTIRGLRAAAIPLIEATSVTNDASGQTIIDTGPPPKGPGRGWWDRGPGQATLQGRVRMTLHGPKGDINGALLDDGAIVRLPPPEAARFAALLSPGQTISVEGDVNASVLGRVIDATAIGASSATLNPVDAPPRLPRPGGPEARWDAPPPPRR